MTVSVKGKEPKELREMAADLHTKIQSHHSDNADNWTAECEGNHKAMVADMMLCKTTADRITEIGDLHSASSGEPVDRPDPTDRPGNPDRRRNDLRDTIMMRDGVDASGSPRYREVAAERRGSEAYRQAFARHLQTGSMAAGLDINSGENNGISQYATMQSDNAERAGYLVASEQFASELLREVDDMLFIRRRAKIHQVRQASSLGIRKRNQRLNTFDWTAELQVAPPGDITFSKKTLTPHHLTGQVRISRDLARRSVISAEGEVRSEMARDAGEVMEDAYLLGDGRQKPLGVFVPSADGISTSRDKVTGSNTGFTGDALISATFGLKAQYRVAGRGQLSWLFHREAIEKITLLKDNDGQYLFKTGVGFAADNDMPESRLLGIPVDESERCPNTFTAGNYVGILANWRYYEIADALDMEMQVLYELFALTNEIGYIGRLKTDGMPTLEEAFVRLKCGT